MTKLLDGWFDELQANGMTVVGLPKPLADENFPKWVSSQAEIVSYDDGTITFYRSVHDKDRPGYVAMHFDMTPGEARELAEALLAAATRGE